MYCLAFSGHGQSQILKGYYIYKFYMYLSISVH